MLKTAYTTHEKFKTDRELRNVKCPLQDYHSKNECPNVINELANKII